MRRLAFASAAVIAALAASAAPASAQLGVGARIGTLGVGADVIYGLGSRLALRAGAGVMPLEPEGDFSDITYKVELPSPLFTAGADFYVTSGLRLFGGMLFGADEASINGRFTGSQQIGNQTYTGADVGNLIGRIEPKTSPAPFAGIGIGSGRESGIGIAMDFGVAFLGEPDFTLTADGPLATDQSAVGQQFRASLAQEEAEIQSDLNDYAKYYPIINIAVRFGLGSR